MKVLLTTLNAKYIHKNLALRWLYVASPNKKETYLKEFTINQDLNFIAERIVEHPCQVVAFSTYVWNIQQIREVVRLIKLKCSKHIILGGPEVSYDSFELLDHGVNALSLGEGEESFWNYIEMLDNKQEYEVNGICTRKFYNKVLPKVDLSKNETYENPYFLEFDQSEMKNRYFYLETSRGCPYKCEYCLSSTDNNVRYFSEEYIFDILERLSNSDVKVVKLLDRTFNTNPKRALKLARYMNEKCVNQIFQFEIVAESLDEKMIDFMINEMDKKRFRFEVGVQSFNAQALKSVGRNQDNTKLVEVIQKLVKANVVLHVDLIAALPYEDLNSFKQSFNELFMLNAHEIQLGVLKLLKGTKLREKASSYEYESDLGAPYSVISSKWLTNKELQHINEASYAVEKTFNNNRARRAILKLIELKYINDPFSFFYVLGESMAYLRRPYLKSDLFMCIKQSVSGDSRIIDAILKADYYEFDKVRPRSFVANATTKEIRSRIKQLALKKGLVSNEVFNRYSYMDSIYLDSFGYQLIIYQNKGKERYFIDEDIEEIKRI